MRKKNMKKLIEKLQVENKRILEENKEILEKNHKLSYEKRKEDIKLKRIERIKKYYILENTIFYDGGRFSFDNILKCYKEKISHNIHHYGSYYGSYFTSRIIIEYLVEDKLMKETMEFDDIVLRDMVYDNLFGEQ